VTIITGSCAPEGYHAAAPATIILLSLILFAIYGASIAIRSFALRCPITIFEIGQAQSIQVVGEWSANVTLGSLQACS